MRSVILSLSGWEIVEWLSVVAVVVTVWGEEWAEKRKLPYDPSALMPDQFRNKKLAVFFWKGLVVALAVEFIALVGTTWEHHREVTKDKQQNLLLAQKVEELRNVNLKLEAELEKQKPRRISDMQKQYASTLLGRYSGTPVLIRWIGQDADTDMFANAVGEMLSSLGWKVSMDEGWMIRGSGVAISPYKLADLNAAIALEVFLTRCDITAEYVGPQFMETERGKWSESTNASVLIVIGYKGNKVRFNFGPSHSIGVQW